MRCFSSAFHSFTTLFGRLAPQAPGNRERANRQRAFYGTHSMSFETLNLDPALTQAIQDQGYETPTPIQSQAIPLVLSGQDLLAGAQTGTGKTAAFTLPLLHRLHNQPAAQKGAIRALVLTPTRELAAQVEDSVRVYGKHLKLRSTAIFGGVGLNPQVKRLQAGVDVLVATPGRLLDLADQGLVNLAAVEMLVLDEADRMLDMGFIHDVKKVLKLLPASKQSLLFSATFSEEIRALAATLLKNPASVQVTPPNTTAQRIDQTIYPVGRERKKDLLLHILQSENWSQVLVFTRTKFGANHVADFLESKGVHAMALHGNKSQTARTQALKDFKNGTLRALVATDIAARGIDIDDLPHVVNYDIPNVPEDYVHRIGRTGRAGASGQAVSLVCLDEEGFMQDVERFVQLRLEVKVLPEFGPAPDETAQPIAMGRQVLWGGRGRAPGRDVMSAAARQARQDMMQRLRERNNKPARHAPQPNQPSKKTAAPVAATELDDDDPLANDPHFSRLSGRPMPGNSAGAPGAGNGNRRRRRNRNGQANGGGGGGGGGGARAEAGMPSGARQPDPLRTSIDSLGRGNGGGRNRGRGRANGGGGGGGSRGPADPLRTNFGRLK
jgi:ATP-dependent RNA helicase RhlE